MGNRRETRDRNRESSGDHDGGSGSGCRPRSDGSRLAARHPAGGQSGGAVRSRRDFDAGRRAVLRGSGILALAGVAGLSGCIGDGSSGDGDDDDDDDEGGIYGTTTGTRTRVTTTETPPETTTTEAPTETTTTTSTRPPTERTIRMGVLMGVSEGLEDLGPPIRDAALLVARYVEEADTEFEVDVRFDDTEVSPATGISAAEAIVDAGYPAIVGALSSTVTIQVAENVSIPNGVVQCSPASTAPAISDLDDDDYVWRTVPTDALAARAMARVGRERLGARTTSTLALDNAYGQAIARHYADAWRARGGTVQDRVSFEPGRSSYSAELDRALADDPDLLMVAGYPDSGVVIFRDFYDDYSRDFCDVVVPSGLKSSTLPDHVGNPMRNVWGVVGTSDGPGREFFDRTYRAEYGESTVVPFVPHAWDAAAVVCLASAAAGENDGRAIRAAMRDVANPGGRRVTPETLPEGLEMAATGTDVQYEGAATVVDFDGVGDLATATYELFRYRSSGPEPIDEVQVGQ